MKPQDTKGTIVLRLPMAKKSAYVRAAKPGKLAEWCIKNLDAAAQQDLASTSKTPQPATD